MSFGVAAVASQAARPIWQGTDRPASALRRAGGTPSAWRRMRRAHPPGRTPADWHRQGDLHPSRPPPGLWPTGPRDAPMARRQERSGEERL